MFDPWSRKSLVENCMDNAKDLKRKLKIKIGNKIFIRSFLTLFLLFFRFYCFLLSLLMSWFSSTQRPLPPPPSVGGRGPLEKYLSLYSTTCSSCAFLQANTSFARTSVSTPIISEPAAGTYRIFQDTNISKDQTKTNLFNKKIKVETEIKNEEDKK